MEKTYSQRELLFSGEAVNVAFRKPVHASTGKDTAQNITDGDSGTVWQGEYYPSYIDVNLEKNYYLDCVEVYTPEKGSLQYTVFTSRNGRDFEEASEGAITDEVCRLHGREARIIRIYAEYDSASAMPVIGEVRAAGVESGTAIQQRPPVRTESFEGSAYDVPITAEDTYGEVKGIIERRLGAAYKSWFALELAENPVDGHAYDYFELTNRNGKIQVKGNTGVMLAAGIHHYLKYHCKVHVSQVGDQISMPKEVVPLEGPVFRETKAEVRYAYNYCTLSYSMAFWGREEWRAELDWLALNGVNLILDATAQEEVWRRFLEYLGYGHEDIKDFIAGPAYYAWAYMANLSGFGGPVHDSWFEERTELARENHLIMRRLGMQPVLQGYSGMVPWDIQRYDPEVEVIEQGTWCSFRRPHMLKTTAAGFERYAELFYRAQREVYGDVSDYYATDPFHEGGDTGGMPVRNIAEKVLSAMLSANADAVWVIQSWQGNPASELLAGLEEVPDGKNHALILDLYADKTPHYKEGASTNGSYGYEEEFNHTPWLFCMLNNFGGRLGMHGHLDNLVKGIPYAFNHCSRIAGIGITPEASGNNPVLYDFFFDTIWQEDASKPLQEIELESWLDEYATRRYGKRSEAAREAWNILRETVYKAEYNQLGQGAPESVVNARPALDIQAASAWGNAVISYRVEELKKAAALLLGDYEALKGSEGYLYDVVTVLQQVLSNAARECQQKMSAAFEEGNAEAFTACAEQFLSVMDDMETVTGANKYYLLGRWVEQAKSLAEGTDDFTRKLLEINAKALITTWGSCQQSEIGHLHDYSNRQWAGLISDFYKPRWERWIGARTAELKNEPYEKDINWFQWEWSWVRARRTYATMPTCVDLKELGNRITADSADR